MHDSKCAGNLSIKWKYHRRAAAPPLKCRLNTSAHSASSSCQDQGGFFRRTTWNYFKSSKVLPRMWGGAGNSAAPSGAQLSLDDRKRDGALRVENSSKAQSSFLCEKSGLFLNMQLANSCWQQLQTNNNNNKNPKFRDKTSARASPDKENQKGIPDLPLPPVFAASGVTSQGIFAVFVVSSHLKPQFALISFPLPLKARGMGVCSVLPWALGIAAAKEWGWNACQEKMKVLLLLSYSNCHFPLFWFYSFNSWKEKQRQKSKHPNQKKKNNPKTTTQPPVRNSHSNRALSLQVTEIHIC